MGETSCATQQRLRSDKHILLYQPHGDIRFHKFLPSVKLEQACKSVRKTKLIEADNYRREHSPCIEYNTGNKRALRLLKQKQYTLKNWVRKKVKEMR